MPWPLGLRYPDDMDGGGLQEYAEFTQLNRGRLSSLQGQNFRRNSVLYIGADRIQKV
jgi:hypothetical protein